ncbi:MAG: DUF72 domain-containing protein [Steroidobacteraceae bacterium]
MTPGNIRVGIGGWDYAPWRETFYPADVPKTRQLEFASRHVTTIEVNGTFYRLQTPETFAKWHDTVPDDFVFSLKASRFVMNRRELSTAGESMQRFLGSGIVQLKEKLGPILWQLAPTAQFHAEDLEGFLKLLPDEISGQRLRHVLEVRHESFEQEAFIDLVRQFNVATVLADSKKYPSFADATADFIYARLLSSVASRPEGYEKKALAKWAERATQWAEGDEPDDLPRLVKRKKTAAVKPRDVFIYVINGAKERAPAAAMKLLEYLRDGTPAPSKSGKKKPLAKGAKHAKQKKG